MSTKGLPDAHELAQEALDYYDRAPVSLTATERALLDPSTLVEEMKRYR